MKRRSLTFKLGKVSTSALFLRCVVWALLATIFLYNKKNFYCSLWSLFNRYYGCPMLLLHFLMWHTCIIFETSSACIHLETCAKSSWDTFLDHKKLRPKNFFFFPSTTSSGSARTNSTISPTNASRKRKKVSR